MLIPLLKRDDHEFKGGIDFDPDFNFVLYWMQLFPSYACPGFGLFASPGTPVVFKNSVIQYDFDIIDPPAAVGERLLYFSEKRLGLVRVIEQNTGAGGFQTNITIQRGFIDDPISGSVYDNADFGVVETIVSFSSSFESLFSSSILYINDNQFFIQFYDSSAGESIILDKNLNVAVPLAKRFKYYAGNGGAVFALAGQTLFYAASIFAAPFEIVLSDDIIVGQYSPFTNANEFGFIDPGGNAILIKNDLSSYRAIYLLDGFDPGVYGTRYFYDDALDCICACPLQKIEV